ncbi:ATP-binding protein [Pseudomonas atacamensis]|uniref:ATP-binding protein n=1 Tax=Pseudomonas atacamensis TaxID=2565368 RepID=UPI00385783D0
MRLSSFILANMEPIVQEWEDFARTMTIPGDPLDVKALRNDSREMLHAIAEDLSSAQSPEEQIEKSQGLQASNNASAAKTHAIARLASGFSIDQLVSEFRALRASVIKLWLRQERQVSSVQLEDMIRFNEAIDQALTESITSYTRAVQTSRDIFLGTLGHDLRTPLSAILLGADVLLRSDDLPPRSAKIAAKIYSSVKRATQIAGDLLDFTRCQLGPGIPLNRQVIDIQPICANIVEEARTIYADAVIQYSSFGKISGFFDSDRLEQVFSNLITNAIKHGSAIEPVDVTLGQDRNFFHFRVHNAGAPIGAALLASIFNPMARFPNQEAEDYSPQAGVGLGLFIASQIVEAHGGHIHVNSSEENGTEFLVAIPLNGASLRHHDHL